MLTKDEKILQTINKEQNKLVGFKQFARLVKEGKAKKAVLALDADEAFKKSVEELAKECGIELSYVNSKKAMGNACNIDVDAGIVTIY